MIFLKKNKLYLFSILLLFCCFKYGSKEGVSYDYVSESLVVGRIIESEKSGVLSYSGLLGIHIRDSNDDNLKQNSINQFILLKNKGEIENFKKFKTYHSQTGGQGILYSIFNEISPFSIYKNILILKNITLLFNAIIFSVFLGWCRRNFGNIPALTTLFFISVSSWIWLFSDSLYWCLWAFYLPFVTMLLSLEFFKSRPEKILLLTFISIFFKCFFNGFEYITTTLIAVYVPIVYYYIKENKKIKDLFIFSFKTAIILLLGIMAEMCVLLFQLKQLKGSFTEGLKYIFESYNIRTASVIIEGKTAEISNNMYLQIILRYLSGNIFSWLRINIPFIILIAFVFISSIILLKINHKKYNPIIIATWFSIIAPLSWFIVFIQHSYVHAHLNFIIWYIPFFLFGMLILGLLLEILIKKITKKHI